jgi:hypothetical protein
VGIGCGAGVGFLLFAGLLVVLLLKRRKVRAQKRKCTPQSVSSKRGSESKVESHSASANHDTKTEFKAELHNKSFSPVAEPLLKAELESTSLSPVAEA